MLINGIILVRSKSKRLKNKCYLKFGNNTTVIEHIIKRAKYFKIDPILCTTKNLDDKKLKFIAKKNNVRFFSGSEKNKILRISECCKFYKIKSFHTIDADDPFFCGHEIKASIKLLQKGYDIIKPSITSANGGASVGFSVNSEIFHHLSLKIKKNINTEMMWKFFHKKKNIKIKVLPKQKYEIKNCRLTLDYQEDYIFLSVIRLILGNYASRKNIFNLIKNNHEISDINFFRNEQWKENQNK